MGAAPRAHADPGDGYTCPEGSVRRYGGGGVIYAVHSGNACPGRIYSHTYTSAEVWAAAVTSACIGADYREQVDWKGGPYTGGDECRGAQVCLDADWCCGTANGGAANHTLGATLLLRCVSGYFLAQPQPPPEGCTPPLVGDPVSPCSGNEHRSETDYRSGDGGLTLVRHYDSSSLARGALGPRWQFEHERRVTSLYDALGVPPDDGPLVSEVYPDAEHACTQGWNDLAPSLRAGRSARWKDGACQLSDGSTQPVLSTDTSDAWRPSSAPGRVAGLALRRADGAQLAFQCSGGACAASPDVVERLAASANGYTAVDADDSVETYAADGRLLAVRRRGGATLAYTWDADGRLRSVTDAHGRALEFTYAQGRVVHVATPGGGVDYAYDAGGRLERVTDAAGRQRSYHYDDPRFPDGLTAVSDGTGATVAQIAYDTQRRVIAASGALGADAVTLDYASADSTVVRDALGTRRTWRYRTLFNRRRLVAVDGPPCADCGPVASLHHDARGHIDRSTDRRGTVTAYTHDARGLESVRVEAQGTAQQRRIETDWHADFRVPLEQRLFDAAGTLQQRTQWRYDGSGRVVATCRADPANAAALAYDCASAATPVAGVQRTRYAWCSDADVAATPATCPLPGLRAVDGPRPAGDAGMARGANDVTTFAYYAADDLAGCGTPGGACHRAGDLWKTTDGAGLATEIVAYDADGWPLRLRDPNGVVVDLERDRSGKVTARTVRARADAVPDVTFDATTRYLYDAAGRLVRVTGPDGDRRDIDYDAAGRATGQHDALGERLVWDLDAAGHRLQESIYDGTRKPDVPEAGLRRRQQWRYDADGRLRAIVDGDGRVVETRAANGYDANGNLLLSTDATGVRTQREYDALDRLVRVVHDAGGADSATRDATSLTVYDALDRVRSVTDADGVATTYRYDGLGNLVEQVSRDTGTTRWTYDAAGNRRSAKDARNLVSTWTYDAAQRLVGIAWPRTTALQLTYDVAPAVCPAGETYAKGRLARSVDAAGSIDYCYDLRGNVVRKRQSIAGGGVKVLETRYAWSRGDRLLRVTYPDGAVASYSRDGLGRVVQLRYRPAGGTTLDVLTAVSYLPFGPRQTLRWGNGRVLERGYDRNYRVVRVSDAGKGGLDLAYTWNVRGELTTLAAGAEHLQRDYAYDALRRLVRSVDPADAAPTYEYAYSRAGDRIAATIDGVAHEYTYAPATRGHRLLAVDGVARRYDANGNTLGVDARPDATYDAGNRLVAEPLTPTSGYTYAYATRGERVLRRYLAQPGGGVDCVRTELYGYDETGHVLTRYDSGPPALKACAAAGTATDAAAAASAPTPAPAENILLLDDVPVAVARGNALAYLETDALDTPRVALDAARNAVLWRWSAVGEPYGRDAPVSVDPSGTYALHLRFPGQWADVETAHNYNYFRDYEPATGRYLQSDPLGLEDGPNTYAYAHDDPLGRTDPTGLGGGASVCCRRLRSFPAGWPLGHRHCYLTVRGHSYGLYPSLVPGGAVGNPVDDAPEDRGGTCRPCRGKSCDDPGTCIIDGAHHYPVGGYAMLGPNSNTFAGSIARRCCDGGMPPGLGSAPGADDMPPSRDHSYGP